MEHILSFRKFMELVQTQPSYVDRLGDELNLSPDALASSPQFLSNATLGKTTYMGTTYSFRYIRDEGSNIIGAMVKPLHTTRSYSKDADGRVVRNPIANPDQGKEFFVNKAQLNKMMTQEVPPAPPPIPAMPGAEGMPPMPGGM